AWHLNAALLVGDRLPNDLAAPLEAPPEPPSPDGAHAAPATNPPGGHRA
ncbi:MAG: hypothetical protein JWN32_3610, partial [Solirubrobacterales bacterium]|nr:hypothetical protein [Solirubrobacterales bacterium]